MHRNLKLQSLLALSAGAIGLPQVATAQSIVYSGVIDEQVGFSSGFDSSYTLNLPGTAQLAVVTQHNSSTTYHSSNNKVSFKQANGYARIRNYSNNANASFAKRNSAGPKWDQVGGAVATTGKLGSRESFFGMAITKGPGSFSNKYVAFEFTDSNTGAMDYGWALFSMTESAAPGPDVTLQSYAYDASGAEIPMGAVPEPSAAALAVFGALALGGVRRWRASKQSV